MNLPELPNPAIQTTAFSRDNSTQGYFTETQMLALRAATVEACAAVCDESVKTIWYYHDDGRKQIGTTVCNNLANAIRGMKPLMQNKPLNCLE